MISSVNIPHRDLRVDVETSEHKGDLVRVTHMPTGLIEEEDSVTGSVNKAIERLKVRLAARLAGK